MYIEGTTRQLFEDVLLFNKRYSMFRHRKIRFCLWGVLIGSFACEMSAMGFTYFRYRQGFDSFLYTFFGEMFYRYPVIYWMGYIGGLALLVAWHYLRIFTFRSRRVRRRLKRRMTGTFFKEEEVFVLSEQEIRLSTPNRKTGCSWNLFDNIVETNEAFAFLFNDTSLFFLLPKREISKADQEQLHSYIQHMFPDHNTIIY